MLDYNYSLYNTKTRNLLYDVLYATLYHKAADAAPAASQLPPFPPLPPTTGAHYY